MPLSARVCMRKGKVSRGAVISGRLAGCEENYADKTFNRLLIEFSLFVCPVFSLSVS